jgi:hypothetical protein
MDSFCTNDAKSVHAPHPESGDQLTNVKSLTLTQIKRRAAYARLMGSLNVTPNTKLLHNLPSKTKPAGRRFATI